MFVMDGLLGHQELNYLYITLIELNNKNRYQRNFLQSLLVVHTI